MTNFRQLYPPLIALMTMLALPAGAQEAAYPIGGRIGLVTPKGMEPSQNLQGFEDREREAGIIVMTLSARSYATLEKVLTAQALKKEGVVQEKRERVTTPFGKAVVIVGRQKAQGKTVRKWVMLAAGKEFTALVTAQIPEAALKTYPDAAIRAALATLTVREKIPDTEQLSLLPFTLESLAEFQIAAVVPGRTLLLSDATKDEDVPDAAHFVVTVGLESPPQADQRDAFARRIFSGIANIKEITIQSSETLRMGGQIGHQILADAKDATTNADLKLVQWLRFGTGAHMQMVGTAQANNWSAAFTRFRMVRDGISPR